MSGYNHVTLVGNLVRDPEVKKGDDFSRCSFSLAVSRNRKKDENTIGADFINIIAWNKLGELCAEYLTKGNRVLVDGKIHIRDYEQDKQKKKITEVHADNVTFLDYSPERNPAKAATVTA